jgi:hypothetical protein
MGKIQRIYSYEKGEGRKSEGLWRIVGFVPFSSGFLLTNFTQTDIIISILKHGNDGEECCPAVSRERVTGARSLTAAALCRPRASG